MKRKLVIDGNAVYDVDEDCLKRKKDREDKVEKRTEHTRRYEEKKGKMY
jgi:hypothetical protein